MCVCPLGQLPRLQEALAAELAAQAAAKEAATAHIELRGAAAATLPQPVAADDAEKEIAFETMEED